MIAFIIIGLIPVWLFLGVVIHTLVTGRDKGHPFTCRMGWHKAPNSQGFNGLSFNGKCPKCGAFVMLDSQGNWFGDCPSINKDML